MTTAKNKLNGKTRKLAEDVSEAAQTAAAVARESLNRAGNAATVLIEKGRDAASDAADTTRRRVKEVRVKGRELESSARGLAAKAAEKLETASRKLKVDQQAKRRKADGKKGAAIKALKKHPSKKSRAKK